MKSTLTNVEVARWIGQFKTNSKDPSIIFLSGIHGNELTGVRAIEHVFSEIKKQNIPLAGNIYGIRGNLKAIDQGERFIDIDLNRAWTDRNIKRFTSEKKLSESNEVIEIKEILDTLIKEAEAPLYIVDLHTTSSSSPPFVILDDTIRNRKFANILPATKVLGILEKLKGTILGYYGDKGPVTLVFEAGQHTDEQSFERHTAAVWLLLSQSNIIEANSIPVQQYKNTIKVSDNNALKIVQTTYRHILTPKDHFVMKPGYDNFSPISKGEVIAHQNGNPIIAEEDANIFMPLYQDKGEDGYFIVKPLQPFLINFSKVFRKLKVEKLLSILPGIKVDSEQKDSFVINRKVASYRSIELLHLFGFRKEDERGQFTFVSRRPYDFKGPWD